MTVKLKALLLAFCAAALPVATAAHPAEQALVLLLPTELYTLGGTLAVTASILLMGFLPTHAVESLFRHRRFGIAQFGHAVENVCSMLALGIFMALVLIGFAGPNDPQNNLLPLTIWTGWWIGVFVIQGLVFDIWRLINPWSGLSRLIFANVVPLWRLPARLGRWPAVIVFLSFQLFLLADFAPNDPGRLATISLGYWLFTSMGIVVFGMEAWLSRVECFTVLFRLVGSLRIFQAQGQVGLAGWASVALAPLDSGRAVFCLMILISGSFDGLHETFWWLGNLGVNPLEYPGRSAMIWPTSIGLLGALLGGIAVYALSIWLGVQLLGRFGTTTPIRFRDAFDSFAIAILPIALGYHFAHYFVSFLVQVQYLAATLADPLAKGWNLFGLGRVTVTTGFLNTMDTVRPILLTNVTAVVLSHALSVTMAHRLAGQFASTRRDVILVQLGLSLLMIVYTIFGLWLLSTPRGA